ncbi:hypothetical protein BDR03DRAFT_936636 [Suillus americanus]|nr:hypothetical protein BDR03DRAFT_936636 [Suillus americanus]
MFKQGASINIPTFGWRTIHQFHNNTSAMKCLTARDFEDLLQCALPVFEGILIDKESKDKEKAIHNKVILDLLFDLAAWHAYAKLRLHTDDTLAFFDSATVALGQSIWKFQRTMCKYYHTMELPHEHAAHGHRQAALASKQPGASHTVFGPKVKRLNLNTYKYHALADYPNTIYERGTIDSFNSQLVCTILFHLISPSNVPPGKA